LNLDFTHIPHIGEIFALAAPISWSIAIILFRKTGELVPPLALNQFKNVLAIAMFALTMVATGSVFFEEFPRSDYLLLLLSGAIGIGISDTFFFLCLNRIGAGLQAIVTTSYSPIIIALSFLFLGERLQWLQFLGAASIVGAVLAVSWTRGPRAGAAPGRGRGILYGLVATSTQGISIVMIKPLLNEAPMLWVTFWRLIGGLVVVGLLLLLMPAQRQALHTLKNLRAWPVMVPGSIMGTYVALFFWIGGMKHTQASVAAALNQTSTLWTFALAVLILKEPFTRRRAVGILLGLVGVVLVTLGG
jgi:drug/metabolite transporter (DMT)-like permease